MDSIWFSKIRVCNISNGFDAKQNSFPVSLDARPGLSHTSIAHVFPLAVRESLSVYPEVNNFDPSRSRHVWGRWKKPRSRIPIRNLKITKLFPIHCLVSYKFWWWCNIWGHLAISGPLSNYAPSKTCTVPWPPCRQLQNIFTSVDLVISKSWLMSWRCLQILHRRQNNDGWKHSSIK